MQKSKIEAQFGNMNEGESMRKIGITVAPVSLDIKGSTLNPIDVANEVIECAKSGASSVHLHVRDKMGNPTFNLKCFTETLDLIRKESNIIIQGSTGGVSDLTLKERCISLLEKRTQTGSLNMGSVNLGEAAYVNSFSDIRFWAEEMKNQKVIPEFEIFEIGMINNVRILIEEGFFKPPYVFQFCMGFNGAMPSDARILPVLVQMLPSNSIFGIAVHGKSNFSLLGSAIALGASFIRVGFEDSAYLSDGNMAINNVELVKKASELINATGNEVATINEMKMMMEIVKN